MLTPREFNEKYTNAEIEEELLNRPIAGLRDIQYVYGKLYTLATAGAGKYAPYLTPNNASNLFDEDNSLLAVRVDLSGETPKIDPDTPVEITEYTEDNVDKVALAAYLNKGRGIEHSITHKTGSDKTKTDMIGYAEGRLQRWPSADAVTDVMNNHEDGWIIESLDTLGKDKGALRTIGEHIYRNFDDERRSLVTVRIKVAPDDEYLWPGELDVLSEGMKQLYESRLTSKNDASDAEGKAADIITDEMTTVGGTTPDPLNYYLTAQTEKFPNFDPNESWRTHSVSKKSGVAITNAATFITACSYSGFNSIIYYLPYITGEMAAEDARILYELLYRTVNSSDLTPIEEAYKLIKESDKEPHETGLRFYVTLLNKVQPSTYDVFHQEMEITLHYPSELAEAHENTLKSWVYDAENKTSKEISAPLPTHESWNLLNPRELTEEIVTGSYFFESMIGDKSKITAMGGRDPEDNDSIANDNRVSAFIATLTGDRISVEMLLENFVGHLENNPSDQFPTMEVAGQFAQLSALAERGHLISHSPETELLTVAQNHSENKPEHMTSDNDTDTADDDTNDEKTKKELRREKLNQFLEETPAFENEERRGAFLVGVLVGQLSVFQSASEDLSQTLVDEYPINSINQRRIKQIMTKAIDRNLIYSNRNNYQSMMYEEVIDKLLDSITTSNPDTWRISSSDIKFNYALGVSYGQNNRISTDNETDETEDATQDTEATA